MIEHHGTVRELAEARNETERQTFRELKREGSGIRRRADGVIEIETDEEEAGTVINFSVPNPHEGL